MKKRIGDYEVTYNDEGIIVSITRVSSLFDGIPILTINIGDQLISNGKILPKDMEIEVLRINEPCNNLSDRMLNVVPVKEDQIPFPVSMGFDEIKFK